MACQCDIADQPLTKTKPDAKSSRSNRNLESREAERSTVVQLAADSNLSTRLKADNETLLILYLKARNYT